MTREKSCFISHHRHQKDWAVALRDHLEELGAQVFIDQQTGVGEDWAARLSREVSECRLFVLLATPDSMASDWVAREIAIALQAKKKVFPVLLQSTDLPPFVASHQHFDLRKYGGDAYRKLLTALLSELDCRAHPDRLAHVQEPPAPVRLLRPAVLDAVVKLAEPLCEADFSLRGLAASLDLDAAPIERQVTARLRASALVVRACEESNQPPLATVAHILDRWKREPRSFPKNEVLAAIALVEKELRDSASAAPADADAMAADLLAYRGWLETRTATARIGALESGAGVQIQLSDIYVEQRGSYSHAETQEKGSGDAVLRRHEIALLDAATAAIQHGYPAALLLGPAGAGKTTTLRLLAYRTLKGDKLQRYTPLFLPLRLLTHKNEPLDLLLQVDAQKASAAFPRSFFREQLRRGSCLVMLDGLDEIADRRVRAGAIGWIEDQMRAFPNNFFFVTCRDYVYRALSKRFSPRFLRVDIQTFSREDIQRFLRVWYDRLSGHPELGATQTMESPRREADRLADVIATSNQLARLAAVPMMLEIMALVNLLRGALPQHRVELYRECVALLAFRLDHQRRIGPPTMAIDEQGSVQVVERAARWLHGVEGRTRARLEELQSALLRVDGYESALPHNAPDVLARIVDRGALLHTDGSSLVGFEHLVFQEYLTAASVRADGEYSGIVAQLGNAWWMGVILLLLGHRDPSPFAPFMKELVASGAFATQRDLVLECVRAAEGSSRPPKVLVDVLVDRHAHPDARYTALLALRETGLGDFRDVVVEALRRDESQIGHVGSLLLGINDGAKDLGAGPPPRWRNTKDGMEYVLVPEGPFEMGARPEDESCIPQETPHHEVFLSAYYMAVHPVTNEQYAMFLKATGLPPPRGQDWWNQWIGGVFASGMANHPVVFVTWYDALRYCEWAECALPTEAQWEKAARGAGSASFPWAKRRSDHENLLNFNSNVGRTTEVGRYPDGVSPYGCLDMAGNVWEWCSDWFHPSAYHRSSGRDPAGPRSGTGRRVDRGGGWQMDLRRCRAAYRSGWPPGSPNCDLGFRTVVPVHRVAAPHAPPGRR